MIILGALFLGIVAAIILISLSIADGKNKAERNKPFRSIKSLLMSFLLRFIVMAFAFLLLVFTGPSIRSISFETFFPVGIFYIGVLIFFWIIPERWAHSHFKKKLEESKSR